MLRVLATVSCELRSLTEPRYKGILTSSPEANDRLMNAAIAVREIGDALSKEIEHGKLENGKFCLDYKATLDAVHNEHSSGSSCCR